MCLLEKIIIYHRNKIEDNRGWFLKIITGGEMNLPSRTGEVYVTVAYPGEMKGGHYHLKACEWFTLISGTCVLKLYDIETSEFLELHLNSQDSATVYVPNGIAHGFFNLSSEVNFTLIAYSDELFDPRDTINFDFTGYEP